MSFFFDMYFDFYSFHFVNEGLAIILKGYFPCLIVPCTYFVSL